MGCMCCDLILASTEWGGHANPISVFLDGRRDVLRRVLQFSADIWSDHVRFPGYNSIGVAISTIFFFNKRKFIFCLNLTWCHWLEQQPLQAMWAFRQAWDHIWFFPHLTPLTPAGFIWTWCARLCVSFPEPEFGAYLSYPNCLVDHFQCQPASLT